MPTQIYLEIQGDVNTEGATKGYTRVDTAQGSVAHFIQFLTTAIASGSGPFPAGSRVPVPVSQSATLYFSDAAYGTPPAVGVPPTLSISSPIFPTRPKPVTGLYQAADGTTLQVQTNAGQVVGFTGVGKDGHHYTLSIEISSASAPGRVKGTMATWLFARMTMAQDANPALIVGFGYCPSDNLVNVFAECANVETSLLIDYSQSQLPSGTTTLTNNLTYYNVSFMAQALKFPASESNPGMYLAVSEALWPYLSPLTYFAPALEAIASHTAGVLPKIPAPNTPAVEVGSIAFGAYTPPTLSEASFIYNAIGTVGPALGPLAATAMNAGLSAGSALEAAVEWLAWYAVVIDNSSLIAALAADYQEWVTWYEENQKTGSTQKPVPFFYPKDPTGHMITYHEDPWAPKPASNQAGPTAPTQQSGPDAPTQTKSSSVAQSASTR
jgi:hypothetical protein